MNFRLYCNDNAGGRISENRGDMELGKEEIEGLRIIEIERAT